MGLTTAGRAKKELTESAVAEMGALGVGWVEDGRQLQSLVQRFSPPCSYPSSLFYPVPSLFLSAPSSTREPAALIIR